MSCYTEHKRIKPVLEKAQEKDVVTNPAADALFEAGSGGFHIWCTKEDSPKGWEGLTLCAGGFSKPCGYVASVRWGWGTGDQEERIVSVLLDTTAFELADQRPEKYGGTGSRLLPIRNRAEDIRWAKARIRWLFKQAGVRCPPIVVVPDPITAAPE
jgi:hypothetical protein